MRKAIQSLAFALALTACGGSSSSTESDEGTSADATSGSESEQQPSFTQIGVEEVASALEASDGRIAVYDANSRETFEEHHVPSAVWVDYDAVSAEQLPEDRSTQLVFYCANEQCSASHVAAETARGLGYESVAVMGAGIQGWIAAGKPVESGAAATTEATTASE